MRDAAYCRTQAERCREIALAIGDAGMVEHLLLIAEEYEAEAARMESAPQARPPDPIAE